MYKLVNKGKYPVEKYVQYRNNLNNLIKYCKANYYLNIIKNIVKNSKVAWNVVNDLLGKNNKSNANVIDNLDCNKINFSLHWVTMQLKLYLVKLKNQ